MSSSHNINTPFRTLDHKTDYSILHIATGSGIVEQKGIRPTQEDRVVAGTLTGYEQLLSDQKSCETILTQTFETLEKKIEDAKIGIEEGSTASVVLTIGNKIYTSNLGDSNAFLAIRDQKGNIRVERLTKKLHEPTDPDEAVRIKKNGGLVFQDRVYGSLAVSRAFGDNNLNVVTDVVTDNEDKETPCLKGKEIISHTPDIYLRELDLQPGESAYIINACDGLTEPVAKHKDAKAAEQASNNWISAELSKLFQKNPNSNSPMLAQGLVKAAMDGGTRDNVSVIVTPFDPTNTTPKYTAIFDGHGGDAVSELLNQQFHDALIENIQLQLKKQATATTPATAAQPTTTSKLPGTSPIARPIPHPEVKMTPEQIERINNGWLTDKDISDYLQKKLPRKKGNDYVIQTGFVETETTVDIRPQNNTAGKPITTEEKNTQWIVAVTPAVANAKQLKDAESDNMVTTLPIDYFLSVDASEIAKSTIPEIYKPFLDEKTGQTELDTLQKKHQEAITQYFSTHSNPSIQTIASNRTTLGTFIARLYECNFNRFELLTSFKRVNISCDVFTELQPNLKQKPPVNAKILFPYNLGNGHWITGEIQIQKIDAENVVVSVYGHDPLNPGYKIDESNFKLVNTAVTKRLKEILGTGCNIRISNKTSEHTNKRQNDTNSCGAIVAHEIALLATGVEIPTRYENGAKAQREEILKVIQSLATTKDQIPLTTGPASTPAPAAPTPPAPAAATPAPAPAAPTTTPAAAPTTTPAAPTTTPAAPTTTPAAPTTQPPSTSTLSPAPKPSMSPPDKRSPIFINEKVKFALTNDGWIIDEDKKEQCSFKKGNDVIITTAEKITSLSSNPDTLKAMLTAYLSAYPAEPREKRTLPNVHTDNEKLVPIWKKLLKETYVDLTDDLLNNYVNGPTPAPQHCTTSPTPKP